MTAIATATLPRRSEWFATWFDSPHYHRLYAHRDETEAAAFLDRLIHAVDPTPGCAVLDLGCGSGRHARHLAARGFNVTGIDLSPDSLARARTRPGPYVRFVEQDMRRPFGDGAFDFVLNLFTSFGYFDDRGDHATVVRNIARALRPGGTLVLDYLNADHVSTHLVADETIERDGVRYHVSRWSDATAFFKRVIVNDGHGGHETDHVERVARLTRDDFRQLFAACGLRLDAVYGDYELHRFDPATSPRLILVASTNGGAVEGLPAREVLANAAQGFGRHPEIRGEHRLWDALDNRGIDAEELEIAFFGRGAERADDALILGGGVALQAGPKCGGIAGDPLDQALVGRPIDQQDLGVFDRIDEVGRRRAVVEAGRIGEPPRLRGELDDVLLALPVDDVVAEAAARHERGGASNVAGALQEVASRQALQHKRIANDDEVLVAERGTRLQVGAQHREC